jgi:hypothetical protein
VRFLRARNRQGFNVYLLPYGGQGNAGYIFLDLDQPRPHVLEAMRAHGHEPCVVLETSPGHLQAWVRVSTTCLQPELATALGRHLAHIYGGDLASTDWRHLGRLAGFSNQKLERWTACGSFYWVKVIEARPVLATAAQDLLRSAMQAITDSTASRPERLHGASPTSNECMITAHGAARIYRSWLERWHVQKRFFPVDWSIVDLWLARKLLAMHISPTQVKAILRLGSPDFPRQHGDPEDYLRRTLARAALPAPRPVCSIHAAPLDSR